MSATISREELKAKIDRGDDFQLVEALPEEDFRDQHLPGALNLPPDDVQQRAPQVLPEKDAEIVVYCANTECTASEKAADGLTGLGYRHVRRYVEGKQDWVEAGLPTDGERTAKAGSSK